MSQINRKNNLKFKFLAAIVAGEFIIVANDCLFVAIKRLFTLDHQWLANNFELVIET